MAHIHLKGLVSDEDRTVLSVAGGACLVLLGRDGCGHLDVLRRVAGLDRRGRGVVLIDAQRSLPADAPRDIGLLGRDGSALTKTPLARRLGRLLARRPDPAEAEARARDIAARLEVTPAMAQRPQALSAEQRVALAMARVLARAPRLLLMDAPFAGLDATAQRRLRGALRLLLEQLDLPCILATGDPAEALAMADRLVVMDSGRVLQDGPPAVLYDRPAHRLVAGLTGAPPMNLIAGAVRGGVFHGQNVQVEGLALSDGPVMLGFRAEAAGILTEDMGFTGCEIGAPVQGLEFLGDAVLVTVPAGGTLVSVKTARDCEIRRGDTIRIILPPDICHAFDHETGFRIA